MPSNPYKVTTVCGYLYYFPVMDEENGVKEWVIGARSYRYYVVKPEWEVGDV
jgi:hypothetical protein